MQKAIFITRRYMYYLHEILKFKKNTFYYFKYNTEIKAKMKRKTNS